MRVDEQKWVTLDPPGETYRTMFLCFSSFRRQISLKAELGTPYTRSTRKTNALKAELRRSVHVT